MLRLKSIVFLFGLNKTISVFEKFKYILLALSHFVRFFRPILMNLLRCFALIFNKFVSSAKWWTLQSFMAALRSFMDMRKSNGPNTDPWGTPLVMADMFKLKPLIETNCFRSVKYISNSLFDIPLIPLWSIF